ncbi:MAG TPA: hypothetical protein VNH83_26605 [Bryobacteraceae bacterium]|nr:hypothetical protein [Bryobacteraceae bacterium]
MDEVLLEGIEDNDQGRQLANERLKGLHPIPRGRDRHPRDFEKWLTKIFEREPENGFRLWLTLEFWQQEVDRVLVEGIFSRHAAKDAVVDRIRSVWPKLSPPWLCERMEEVARLGLPRWMDKRFWVAEVDPILLGAISKAVKCQCEAVDMVLEACPQLHAGRIWARLRQLRKRRSEDLAVTSFVLADDDSSQRLRVDGQAGPGGRAEAARIAFPSGIERMVSIDEVDAILRGAIRKASQCEREAVDRVLRRFAELRIGTIWARLRRLQGQRKENGHNGPPFRWTDELDERLIRIHEEAGLSAAVSGVQSLTGWPRKAILRRAHKLGLPSRPLAARRRWTMVEYRFAIESLNHMSVREIAEEIGRSEKAVWDMVGQRGIPARFQDGYTMRELAEKLHVRRLSVQKWVEADLLHRKRNGRIDEGSLQSFFYTHPETLKWPAFDQDTAFWVSELLETERARVKGAEAQTRAMSQNSERMEVTEVSTPDGTVSNAPGADPSGDRESHSSQARGANPRL